MLGKISNEEEIEKYFTLEESLKCNEGGRLEIIMEDENSHLKIPPSQHSDMVHDLTNLFAINFYLIPSKLKQDKWLPNERKNMIHEMFQAREESQGYLEAYEGEIFIITENNITKFKVQLRMY
jgi:hypothetical protein